MRAEVDLKSMIKLGGVFYSGQEFLLAASQEDDSLGHTLNHLSVRGHTGVGISLCTSTDVHIQEYSPNR